MPGTLSTAGPPTQSTDDPQAPHSPSPPPAPPISQSPGPRASKLITLYSNALTHTLKTCSYANFAACFPTPAKHVPESLRALWKQMTDRIEELARGEFEDICRERNVVEGLNELDRLVGEARRRMEREGGRTGKGSGQVPPHTLPPQALYMAHLGPYLAQAQTTLDAKIQTVQENNSALVETVGLQRKEIERLLAGLEDVVKDLENAQGAVAGVFENGELVREMVDVDKELSAERSR